MGIRPNWASIFGDGAPILPPGITMRPACDRDRPLASALYLDSLRRHLFASGEWDEARGSARFRRVFRLEQSQVVCWYGQDIGWFQMSESDRLVRLHQLHIVQELRNRGIGSSIIEAALQYARRIGKPVVLNVMRGNPAINLYLRIGFRVTGSDHEKTHMRWDPGSLVSRE